MRRTIQGIAGATMALLLVTPVMAKQTANPSSELTGFWLTTPYPRLAILPGETESISLTLRNENLPPQRADLEVTGVPQDWKWKLTGGGNQVYEVRPFVIKVIADEDCIGGRQLVDYNAKGRIGVEGCLRSSEHSLLGLDLTQAWLDV